MLATLKETRITIMVLPVSGLLPYNGELVIDPMAGLEAGLIEKLAPPWNQVGNNAVSDEIKAVRRQAAILANVTRGEERRRAAARDAVATMRGRGVLGGMAATLNPTGSTPR
jgi:hypothetical protein